MRIHKENAGWMKRVKPMPIGLVSVLLLGLCAAAHGQENRSAPGSPAPQVKVVTAEKGKYVTLAPSVSLEKMPAGTDFLFTLEVAIKPGYHIQSHKPASDNLIATTLEMKPTPAVIFKEAVFPPAHGRFDSVLGQQVEEYNGKIRIQVPAVISGNVVEPASIQGALTCQTCADSGTCFMPETLAFAIEITGLPKPSSQSMVNGQASVPTRGTPDGGAPDVSAANSHDTPDGKDGRSQTTEGSAASGEYPGRPSRIGGFAELLWYILLGFGGGLVLNVMPCVLPVISLKVLSFVRQAGEDRSRVLRLGLAFSAGIMAWFWLLAVLTLTIGPVMQMQDPRVVLTLCCVMFVLGLSLFGVFELHAPGFLANVAGGAEAREGYGSAFFTGFMATILGTACTAPLLAPAVGFAATRAAGNPVAPLMIFTAAGVGMSLPYLLLSANPAWMKFLPRPGDWMVTFKEVMGFLLVATACWLLWIYRYQEGAGGLLSAVFFLGFLGLGAWLIGKIRPNWSMGSQMATWVAALAFIGAGYPVSFQVFDTGDDRTGGTTAVSTEGGIPWQIYEPNKAERLAAEGYTVYVDYTAKWCLTCQTNKKVALERASTIKLMREMNVIPIEADATKANPDIDKDLAHFERAGVPLNVIYPAGRPKEPIVLPTVLTVELVGDALRKAGPSTQKSDIWSEMDRLAAGEAPPAEVKP